MIRALMLGALLGALICGLVLVAEQIGKPHPKQLPVRSVAPEVCERNGHVVHVQRTDSLIYVQCSDGIVVLLASH